MLYEALGVGMDRKDPIGTHIRLLISPFWWSKQRFSRQRSERLEMQVCKANETTQESKMPLCWSYLPLFDQIAMF